MKGLIFTYVMAYGGAVVSLFKPYHGFLIYVCFAIIKPEAMWYFSVPAGNYSRIIALALLAGWALQGFGSWRLGRAGTIVGALFGFWIWQIPSALQADYPEVSLGWIESFSKIALPFCVGITLIDSVKKLKQLAWVIVLSHAYISYEFNMAYYGGFNRLKEVGHGGMDNNCAAVTLVTCTGLAFFMGLNAPRWWQKGLAFLSAALMMHCVFFSFSRGGMLGLIITAAMSFILIPKKPRHYLIFTLMVLLALRLAGPQVMQRFGTSFAEEETRDGSAQERLDLWKTCFGIMVQHPIFGIGPQNFPPKAHLYGFPPGKIAHTLWLQVGAEHGVIGLGFLVSFYVLCLVRLWPMRREKYPVADPWFRDTARMVIAAITGFAVAAQFVSLPGLESPYYIVLLGAGALKLSSLPAQEAAAAPAAWLPAPVLSPAQWQQARG
jgi:probable O-glycosylation ligase (exosortase A-associated)